MPQLSSRRVYSGRIIHLDVDTVRFPNGSVGELEMIRHPGASAVVPFLSDPAGDDPQILLLKQYRYAAGGPLFEIPAGRLNPDEDPADCARRELREEAGVTPERLERLTSIWTTPGFTDERIHLFWASGLTTGEHAREADEFIEPAPTSMRAALTMIRDGSIRDAKTIVGILYMAGFILGH
jgi:ADP-ribose pyrophosphatase